MALQGHGEIRPFCGAPDRLQGAIHGDVLWFARTITLCQPRPDVFENGERANENQQYGKKVHGVTRTPFRLLRQIGRRFRRLIYVLGLGHAAIVVDVPRSQLRENGFIHLLTGAEALGPDFPLICFNHLTSFRLHDIIPLLQC